MTDGRSLIPARRLILLGCVATKLERAAPAADLYTSTLFRKRRAYAEASGAVWAIVSARHGLLWPDEIVEPYDSTIDDLAELYSRPQQIAEHMWAEGIARELRRSFGRFGRYPADSCWDITFELHAGARYVEPLRRPLSDRHFRWELETPLAGLGIGEQLGWYGRSGGSSVRQAVAT